MTMLTKSRSGRAASFALATFIVASIAASLEAVAQVAAQPKALAQDAQLIEKPVAKVLKKHRSGYARLRRKRHAAWFYRKYYLCGAIGGWRAFPTRDPRGYFDTGPPCF
jgi:hypothetical protein